MAHWNMLMRVMAKALWVRRGKLLLSLTALTVGATLSSAFLSLYFDLPQKMSSEFRTLGPNLVVVPRGQGQTFPAEIEKQIAADHPEAASLPWLYAIGKVQGREVILGGTELSELARLHPGWQGLPSGASTKDSLLAGEKAATAFGWKTGDTVRIAYGEKEMSLALAGIVSTGGSEDSQLLVPLNALETLTGQTGRLSLIQLAVPGSTSEVESAWHEMEARLQAGAGSAEASLVEVRPLRPVVESEARVVMKVRGLMLGLAGIVLALVVLSVLTTVSGRILDRQKDIGVMKALGGSDGAIARFFLAETACQALVAAAAGYALGFALAQLAAGRIFHSALALRWDVAAAVVAVTLGVALIATVLPARWIRRMDAAVILRGE